MKEFTARVLIIGVNPFVRVPNAVLGDLLGKLGSKKGPVPVKGTLNGEPFTQTIVKYQGAWRLYLNTQMRRHAGIDVGDIAHLSVQLDTAPRAVPMHSSLAHALSLDGNAKRAFDHLPPSRRKEILRYLHSLKNEVAVKRNVDKVIRALKGDTGEAPAYLRPRNK